MCAREPTGHEADTTVKRDAGADKYIAFLIESDRTAYREAQSPDRDGKTRQRDIVGESSEISRRVANDGASRIGAFLEPKGIPESDWRIPYVRIEIPISASKADRILADKPLEVRVVVARPVVAYQLLSGL